MTSARHGPILIDHQFRILFVIGDPTEIERPQAWKTDYVGTLKDGKTKGFWALVLATPYRGRAIPCGLVTYSSKTIAQNMDSRNQNHFRAFEELKDLLGERPLVLDREFSYLELMLNLVEEWVNFVIRLSLRANPPKFFDQDGQQVALTISPGETIIHNHVWYMGKVCVNLIGTWKKGFSEPLWVMTNLDATEGRRIYFARMKIEETFRDLKSLLGMTKLMNKQQVYMEKMLAILLLTFTIGLLVGEGIRDHLYGEPIAEDEQVPDKERIPCAPRLGLRLLPRRLDARQEGGGRREAAVRALPAWAPQCGPIVRDKTHYFLALEYIDVSDVARFRPGGAFVDLATNYDLPIQQQLASFSLDHQFSGSSTGFFKGMYEQYRQDNYRVGGVNDVSNGQALDRDNWNAVLGLTTVFGDGSRLKEARFQIGYRDYEEPTNSDNVEESFSSGNTLKIGGNVIGDLIGYGSYWELRVPFLLQPTMGRSTHDRKLLFIRQ